MTLKIIYDMTPAERESEVWRRAINSKNADILLNGETGRGLGMFYLEQEEKMDAELAHQTEVIDYWGDWKEENEWEQEEREAYQEQEMMMEKIEDRI